MSFKTVVSKHMAYKIRETPYTSCVYIQFLIVISLKLNLKMERKQFHCKQQRRHHVLLKNIQFNLSTISKFIS